MTISTTCIGAYPKPDYVPMRDWFQIENGLIDTAGEVTLQANKIQDEDPEKIEALYVRATKAAIEDQVSSGITNPTDGEQRRENYIHYHCRHLNGFDFVDLLSFWGFVFVSFYDFGHEDWDWYVVAVFCD